MLGLYKRQSRAEARKKGERGKRTGKKPENRKINPEKQS